MLELTIFSILLLVSFLLLIISLVKKLVFKPFYIIIALAILLSGAGIARTVLRSPGADISRESGLERNIYMSARLLQDYRVADSLSAAGAACEEAPENRDALLLKAASLNGIGSYDISTRLLEEQGLEEEYGIRESNQKKELLDKEQAEALAAEAIDNLGLSEEEEERFEMMMKLRYYKKGSDVSDISAGDFSGADAGYAEMKLADIENDHGGAYKITGDLANAGDCRAQVALSDLYASGYVPHDYTRADEEYDDYLKRATLLQIEVDEMQEKLGNEVLTSDTDSDTPEMKEYRLKQTEYRMAVSELDHIPELRAVNYLRSIETDPNGELARHIQLARLLVGADREDEARKELDQVFLLETIPEDQWLSSDVILVRDTFLEFLQSSRPESFNSACRILIQDLTQGLSQDDTAFRDVLERYLRELYTGIRIARISTGQYPKVTAELTYAREGLLESSMMWMEDTGNIIDNFELVKADGGESIAVSIVLDVSGSMSGDRIASAKNAIDSFLSSLSGNVMLSFVTFSNDANIIIPFTDSADAVRQAVRRVNASGGTNIASGLAAAQRSLSSFTGSKYIILLSDGYDGSSNNIDSVLQSLSAAGIQTFTIGMQGADEAYLKKIAEHNGGNFVFAKNTAQLMEIYGLLQRSLMNRYYLSYTVSGSTEEKERILQVNLKDSPAYDRKEYVLGFPKAEEQESTAGASYDFYSQLSY